MPRVTIQGEIHTSRKDKAVLQERLSSVDAVMREATDTSWERRWDPMHVILFAGLAIYHRLIQRFLYVSNQSVYDAAEGSGIVVHKLEISLGEWTDRVSTVKELLLVVIAAVMTWGILLDVASPTVRAVVSLPLFVFLFFLFTAVLTIRERDELMVEKINAIMAENDYEHILVSVGDGHVEGIKERLEDQGWDVETNLSQNILARLLRPYLDVLRRI